MREIHNELTTFTDKDLQLSGKAIYDDLTRGKCPSRSPHADILGGQPGAGKTTIQTMIRENNPNTIVINGDDYRREHPRFAQLQERYGDDSVLHTQAFVNAVVEAMIDRLSREKYNLVIEGTLRDPSVPLRTCSMLKERGYTVDLSVMAVSKETSWQGTLQRYRDMEKKGLTPRATPKEKHDDIADKLPDNLGAIFGRKAFDRIALYNRESECLYDSAKTPGQNPRQMLYDIIHSGQQVHNRAENGQRVFRMDDIKAEIEKRRGERSPIGGGERRPLGKDKGDR